MRKLSGWGHVRYEIRTCLDKLTWISSCQILDTWRFGELCSACGKPYNFGHSRLAYSFSKTSNKTYRLFPQPYVRHWQDAQRRLPRVVGSSMLFFSQDERYSTVDGVWWRSTLVPKMCHDNAWKLKIPSTYPSGKAEPSTPNCHSFWGFHVSFRGCFFLESAVSSVSSFCLSGVGAYHGFEGRWCSWFFRTKMDPTPVRSFGSKIKASLKAQILVMIYCIYSCNHPLFIGSLDESSAFGGWRCRSKIEIDLVLSKGCRFVPYTFSETIRHRWYIRIWILVKPGFGGLIQGQIYNPVSRLPVIS